MESLCWPNVLDNPKLMEPRKEQFISQKVLLQRVTVGAPCLVPSRAIVGGVIPPVKNARMGSVSLPVDSVGQILGIVPVY